MNLFVTVLTVNGRLNTFRGANDALTTFNDFSGRRFTQLAKQFEGHTRMLVAMKSDLDQIFRRIRYVFWFILLAGAD